MRRPDAVPMTPRGAIVTGVGRQRGIAAAICRALIQDGWNVLVPEPRDLAAAVSRPRPPGEPPRPYGDASAAARVVAELASRAGPDAVSAEIGQLPNHERGTHGS